MDASNYFGNLERQATLRALIDRWNQLTPAQRSGTSAQKWIDQQRASEEHTAARQRTTRRIVEARRELQRGINDKANARARSRSCPACFQVKAANDTCYCT